MSMVSCTQRPIVNVFHAPENADRANNPISSPRIFSTLPPSFLQTFECIPFLACRPLSLVDDVEELSQSRGILSVQRYLSQGGLQFPPSIQDLQPSFSTITRPRTGKYMRLHLNECSCIQDNNRRSLINYSPVVPLDATCPSCGSLQMRCSYSSCSIFRFLTPRVFQSPQRCHICF